MQALCKNPRTRKAVSSVNAWSRVAWRYIQGVTGGMCETSGECSLGQTIPIYPKTPISKVQYLRRYWLEKFETLTAITHLLINKYILKLAGICGFCDVNICT